MWDSLAISLGLLPFNRRLALLLLVFVLCLAVFHNILTPVAIVFFILMSTVSLLLYHYRPTLSPVVALCLELLLVAGVIALFFHLIPGINNRKLLSNVYVSPSSAPFTLYYNFDKALIPFFLLFCLPSLFITSRRKSVRKSAWLILMLCIPALLSLAVMAGGLKPEFHIPPWTGSFIIANLFFVCIAEEALFRGYLQQRLQRQLGPWPALIISTLLFGMSHFYGGPILMTFAALAGIIYGIAWMWSGRLWVAVLFHFSLNMLHLLFFTYPFYHKG